MSSVSQAARKNQENKQSASFRIQKEKEKQEFTRLSFLNLLFLLTTTVSSPWAVIVGLTVEDKVRH